MKLSAIIISLLTVVGASQADECRPADMDIADEINQTSDTAFVLRRMIDVGGKQRKEYCTLSIDNLMYSWADDLRSHFGDGKNESSKIKLFNTSVGNLTELVCDGPACTETNVKRFFSWLKKSKQHSVHTNAGKFRVGKYLIRVIANGQLYEFPNPVLDMMAEDRAAYRKPPRVQINVSVDVHPGTATITNR